MWSRHSVEFTALGHYIENVQNSGYPITYAVFIALPINHTKESLKGISWQKISKPQHYYLIKYHAKLH